MKSDGTKSNGNETTKADSSRVVVDSTVIIPLSVIYERCKDLLEGGGAIKSQIKSDEYLAISTRKELAA